MKITLLALSLFVGIGNGCTTIGPGSPVSISDLPNCFNANYDKAKNLFTMTNIVGNEVNQQCLLTVGPRGDVSSVARVSAGDYRIYFANGGGGGAGGSLQGYIGYAGYPGGGGGGGGAGADERQETVSLTEGVYKLTIGAGGPGGNACQRFQGGFGGGPGWSGSPSNIVRVATGEVVIGIPGADVYARPSRARNDRMAGKMDGHGGFGPGQASGGRGAVAATSGSAKTAAEPGASKLASGAVGVGGAPGAVSANDFRSGAGGGGGATSAGHGGQGGGESAGQSEIPPERGLLGSGGGGGEGSISECDAGARGGHGYIALRRT